MGLTQVSTDGVKNDAIDASKLPANSVGASELANNAVDTNAIADQAVALSKLPHGDGSSDGKFLRANNGADPTFETISTTPADGSITSAKIADGAIVNADINGSAAIAGTKISPDFGNQNIETDGEVRTGTYIKTRVAGGGHFYLRNNSTGANYSSHFQTTSGGFDNNVQTHIHYYHGGYAELLHQGNSAIRTRSGGGVEFRNGSSGRIGIFDPEGLKFGTDTAAANALDDFEVGTFSPILKRLMSNGTTETNYYTHTHRQGNYTKIGNRVWITGRCHWSGGSTGSGSLILTSLPFSVASGGANEVPLNIGYRAGINYTNITGYAVQGLNRFMVNYFDNNGTYNISPSATANSGGLYFHATYVVA